jgi:L-threonylcarbamoyladenylate synthase
MNFNTIIGTDISKAADYLKNHEIVAIPTETVYGLAANALNENAVSKVYAAKKRPLYNPLIVHIKGISEVEKYAAEIPDLAYKLFETFAPGPLTIILPKKDIIPDITTAGKQDVALRIPNHPLCLSLLEMLDFPLAAPSANPFGYISPTCADHVFKQLNGKIPYILDGGPCTSGLESTVIAFRENNAFLHRLGALGIDDLKKIIPDLRLETKDDIAPVSPGMLKQHYSPNTKLILSKNINQLLAEHSTAKIGIISFQKTYPIDSDKLVILSQSADLNEAASKLYAALHFMDALELDLIISEYMPDEGIGKAMNDRLDRAASKFLK